MAFLHIIVNIWVLRRDAGLINTSLILNKLLLLRSFDFRSVCPLHF